MKDASADGDTQPPERPPDASMSPEQQDAKERAAAKRAAFIEKEKAEKRASEAALPAEAQGLGWRAAAPDLPMILPTKFLSLPMPWVQDDHCDAGRGAPAGRAERSCHVRELEKVKLILDKVERDQSLSETVSGEELRGLRQSVAHIEWASFPPMLHAACFSSPACTPLKFCRETNQVDARQVLLSTAGEHAQETAISEHCSADAIRESEIEQRLNKAMSEMDDVR
jgi:hypothetical protein